MSLANHSFDELNSDVLGDILAYYCHLRVLPDGRICGVAKLLFHWTLHIDIDPFGYADRYCYTDSIDAIAALDQWDGKGDPVGWHRHPRSGRRRDPATGREWIAP
jgi:hypothetical protein